MNTPAHHNQVDISVIEGGEKGINNFKMYAVVTNFDIMSEEELLNLPKVAEIVEGHSPLVFRIDGTTWTINIKEHGKINS